MNLRLPSISKIVSRHWRTMRQDPYLAKVFPQPPLVAYKRPANLKVKLVRAKVPYPAPTRSRRVLNGMKKCNKCPICPFVKTGQILKSAQSKYKTPTWLGLKLGFWDQQQPYQQQQQSHNKYSNHNHDNNHNQNNNNNYNFNGL